MLVLSRRADEKIVIDGGKIVINVVRIRGDKVQLGIEAPEDVRILRGELAGEGS